MKRKSFIYTLLLLLIFSGCKKSNEIVSYHKFPGQTWNRFEKLKFDIPVQAIDKRYDVYFFASHTREYEFDNLDFNMIMETPNGEERIKEYSFLIKDKTGGFTGNCTADSCIATVALKKGLYMDKKGMLRIEIEVLVPRLEIRSLLGVGIRLVPSGQ
jgi:gliding motility-associated lipoprotein GldH